jgi:predicted peptidase
MLVVAVVTVGGRSTEGALLSDFVDFSLRSGSTTLLPGRLYIPPAAISDPSTPRPLVLFLHGAGESGTNNSAQVNGNIDNLLAEAKRRSAFLYAPQTNGGWGNATILNRVNTMLDRALAEQPVDTTRQYVTGLSMGGGGTWNMLNLFGDRFAAGVPICAVGPTGGFDPARLIDMPIWAFHALNDGTVPYTSTRGVIASILSAAGEPLPEYPARPTTDFTYVSPELDLRQTEYRVGGHGIWGRVYATAAVHAWMFAHTTAIPEPAALMLASIGLLGAVARVRRQRAPLAVA